MSGRQGQSPSFGRADCDGDDPESINARRRLYLELWGAIGAASAADRVREVVELLIDGTYDRGLDERTDPYFGKHDTPHDAAENQCRDIDYRCCEMLERIEAVLSKLGKLEDAVDRFMAVFARGMREFMERDRTQRELMQIDGGLPIGSFFRPHHDGHFDPDGARSLFEGAIEHTRIIYKLQLMFHYMPDILASGLTKLTMLKTSGEMDIDMPASYDSPLR